MHFIGNRAIILGDGQRDIQLAYGAGLTALSFLLPIFAVFLAFVAVDLHHKLIYVRLVLGGILAGSAICGMHYLGQASITNYSCVYATSHICGAVAIAIAASIAALGLFFVFRPIWREKWWKRAICAIIMAIAVSGMHWLAALGTEYRLKEGVGASSLTSRDNTAIVASTLASLILIITFPSDGSSL